MKIEAKVKLCRLKLTRDKEHKAKLVINSIIYKCFGIVLIRYLYAFSCSAYLVTPHDLVAVF